MIQQQYRVWRLWLVELDVAPQIKQIFYVQQQAAQQLFLLLDSPASSCWWVTLCLLTFAVERLLIVPTEVVFTYICIYHTAAVPQLLFFWLFSYRSPTHCCGKRSVSWVLIGQDPKYSGKIANAGRAFAFCFCFLSSTGT